MFRHSKLALCLWIFAIALMAMRMSGAHVHLCGDGQDVAPSVHLIDSSPHDPQEHHPQTEGAADHQDRDLKLSDAAIFKKNDTSGDLMPLVLALILLLILPRTRTLIPSASPVVLPLGPRLFFTPPLRGPPL